MKELKIGRTGDNEIVIDDSSVSRFHATLLVDGNKYSVRDNDSTNGTFINGKRINGQVEMQFNDILKVGNALVPWRNFIEMKRPNMSGHTNPMVSPPKVSSIPELNTLPKKKTNMGVVLATLTIVLLLGGVVAFFVLRNTTDEKKMLGTWKCEENCTDLTELRLSNNDNENKFIWQSNVMETGHWAIEEKDAVLILTFEGVDTTAERYHYTLESDILRIEFEGENTEIKLNKQK